MRKLKEILDLDDFYKEYPEMRFPIEIEGGILISGILQMNHKYKDYGIIRDRYFLEVFIPSSYPRDIPRIFEMNNKITEKNNEHRFTDGALCLGTPWEIIDRINKDTSLVSFFESCVVPFLYSFSCKEKNFSDKLIFGELAHNDEGLNEKYSEFLKLDEQDAIKQAIKILKMKKRVANKEICPCGCNKRLAECKYKYIIRNIKKRYKREEIEIIVGTYLNCIQGDSNGKK